MPYLHDEDDEIPILNGVNDAIDAHSDAIVLLSPRQPLHAARTRIFGQRVDTGLEACLGLPWQVPQLTLCPRRKLYLVPHNRSEPEVRLDLLPRDGALLLCLG